MELTTSRNFKPFTGIQKTVFSRKYSELAFNQSGKEKYKNKIEYKRKQH